MTARWIGFGAIEIDGERYDHDVVIDRGTVRKRRKKASKQYRSAYGHTPLSPDEDIPWGAGRLIVGTGAYGSLPIMPEVLAEADRRGVKVIAAPTEEALRLVAESDPGALHAVLHVTC